MVGIIPTWRFRIRSAPSTAMTTVMLLCWKRCRPQTPLDLHHVQSGSGDHPVQPFQPYDLVGEFEDDAGFFQISVPHVGIPTPGF